MYRHSASCVALVLAVVLALPALSQAVYDGFDYTAGESVVGKDGGSGWFMPWQDVVNGAAFGTTDNNLTFLGLTSTGGSAGPQGSGGSMVARPFLNIGGPGQTVYASMLLRFDDLFDYTDTAFGIAGTDFGLLARVDQEGTPRLGIQDYSGSLDPVYTDFHAVEGTTYLLVGEAHIAADGSATGVVSIWENGASGPSASVTLGLPGDWTPGVLAFMMYGYGPVTLDEVRVGLTDPRAVPEAGTGTALLVLAGVGGLGLLPARLRRTK